MAVEPHPYSRTRGRFHGTASLAFGGDDARSSRRKLIEDDCARTRLMRAPTVFSRAPRASRRPAVYYVVSRKERKRCTRYVAPGGTLIQQQVAAYRPPHSHDYPPTPPPSLSSPSVFATYLRRGESERERNMDGSRPRYHTAAGPCKWPGRRATQLLPTPPPKLNSGGGGGGGGL